MPLFDPDRPKFQRTPITDAWIELGQRLVSVAAIVATVIIVALIALWAMGKA